MVGCLQKRVRKQPIIALYFEFELLYLSFIPQGLVHLSQWLEGVQWLSGRVLDSRLRGSGLEPHRRHCVVSLSKINLS